MTDIPSYWSIIVHNTFPRKLGHIFPSEQNYSRSLVSFKFSHAKMEHMAQPGMWQFHLSGKCVRKSI